MSSENASGYNKLEEEFENIEKKRSWPYIYHHIKGESLKNEFTVDEAKKTNNKNLNRYRDVNPYDHSRVILSKEEYDYINVTEAKRKYILTQGPLPNTIIHFWLMVWEQNSLAIIMLNKIFEKNQPKCSQYWPASTTDNVMELPQVDLRVELITETDYSHYIVRNIRLTKMESDDSREILHFHYTTWPDFGVPQSPLAFLKFLRDIRQIDAFNPEYGPPIVHCSAGIGRSGTFCLVDSCLVLAEEKGVDNVDVTSVLVEMRNCRMGLIQTPDQLRFSYVALLQGLKMDWQAKGDDGLPEELLQNGDSSVDPKLSDSEDEAPPLPPPRNPNQDLIRKPLPEPPCEPSDSSSTELEPESDASETEQNANETSINQINESPSETNILSIGVSESRKRKYSETKNKSQRISDKVQEMKNKQKDAEKCKKQRSKEG